MRKTKIICTLGPAVDSEDMIRALIRGGMNAARFNFSHGNHKDHLARLNMLKGVRDSMGSPVATILDTKGPELRIRSFAEKSIELFPGDTFTLTARDVAGKVTALFYPIVVFVVCGFEHSIANMFYGPTGLFAMGRPEYAALVLGEAKGLTWGNFFIKNLVPVTLGNIVGGAVFVGAAYWFVYLRGKNESHLPNETAGKKQ